MDENIGHILMTDLFSGFTLGVTLPSIVTVRIEAFLTMSLKKKKKYV